MPKFYGLSHIGAIRGRMMSIKVSASALGPYALAVGFEQFGAYSSTLRVLTVLPATAMVLVLVAPNPSRIPRDDGGAR